MKRLFLGLLIILAFGSQLLAQAPYPELLTTHPESTFVVLGKVSASGRNIEKAKQELLKQAQKLEAKAVILQECEDSGITREGLTWTKTDAYCEGSAIQFKQNQFLQPK